MFLPNVMNSVGTAILNNERGHGDPKTYRSAFWTNWATVVGLAASAAAVLARLRPHYADASCSGRSFVSGASVANLLFLTVVVRSDSRARDLPGHPKPRTSLALSLYVRVTSRYHTRRSCIRIVTEVGSGWARLRLSDSADSLFSPGWARRTFDCCPKAKSAFMKSARGRCSDRKRRATGRRHAPIGNRFPPTPELDHP